MIFSIRSSEDIERKIKFIEAEQESIRFNASNRHGNFKINERAKENRLHRLCGRKDALMWVLGRLVI